MNNKIDNGNIRTNCKNCAFAIYQDKTQTGCAHNRIQQFDQYVTGAYDEEKEFYIIERFCNYFRDKSWGYNADDIIKVKEQSANTYSIFIDCNEIENEENVIKFISNIDYYSDKIKIVLFHNQEIFERVNKKVANIARNCNKQVSISVICENKNAIFHQTLIKDKTLFHSIISNLENSSVNFAKDIEDLINKKLQKAYVVEHNDNLFVNNNIYKAVSYLNQLYTYEETVTRVIEDSKKLGMYIKHEN